MSRAGRSDTGSASVTATTSDNPVVNPAKGMGTITSTTPKSSGGIWQSLLRFVDGVQDPVLRVEGLTSRVPNSPAGGPPETGALLPFVSNGELFTAERLEELYGPGVLPERRGEWHYEDIPSLAVGESQHLLVWTPAGYETYEVRYPTLYLLHGAGSSESHGVDEWLGYALTEDLDRLIDTGLIEPMIVVLPFGAQGYWVNHADGGPRWSDFVTDEVVPHVDTMFRTDARRERRAVGGLSMGGHGALQIAFRRPDVFATAGAHSPTIRPFEDSPLFFGDTAHFATYDPLTLAQSGSGADRVTTWIDLGNEDLFLASTVTLRDALQARQAELHFHVFEGEHEGWYWMEYLPEYLQFYSRALAAVQYTEAGAPTIQVATMLRMATAQTMR